MLCANFQNDWQLCNGLWANEISWELSSEAFWTDTIYCANPQDSMNFHGVAFIPCVFKISRTENIMVLASSRYMLAAKLFVSPMLTHCLLDPREDTKTRKSGRNLIHKTVFFQCNACANVCKVAILFGLNKLNNLIIAGLVGVHVSIKKAWTRGATRQKGAKKTRTVWDGNIGPSATS